LSQVLKRKASKEERLREYFDELARRLEREATFQVEMGEEGPKQRRKSPVVVPQTPVRRKKVINPRIAEYFDFLDRRELERVAKKFKSVPGVGKDAAQRMYKYLGVEGMVRNLKYAELLSKRILKSILPKRERSARGPGDKISKEEIARLLNFLNTVQGALKRGQVGVQVEEGAVKIIVREPRDHRAKAALSNDLWDLLKRLSGSEHLHKRSGNAMRVPHSYFKNLPEAVRNHPFIRSITKKLSKLRAQK